MKILFVVLMFFSTHAFATNIMYHPIVDPGSKQPAMIYLTDDQNKTCNGKWFIGKVVSDKTGKRLMRNDLCWTLSFTSGNAVDTKIPATGFYSYGERGFGPVPGAEEARNAVFLYLLDVARKSAKAEADAYQQADPRP